MRQLNRAVRVDRNYLAQVILNVLDNGVKYSYPDTQIRVALDSHKDERGNVYWDIIISNTGIRLREEHVERVFEPRYRTDEARDKAILSTGIGLAVARDLVEIMGGMLTAQASVESGNRGWETTFTVSLPRVFP